MMLHRIITIVWNSGKNFWIPPWLLLAQKPQISENHLHPAKLHPEQIRHSCFHFFINVPVSAYLLYRSVITSNGTSQSRSRCTVTDCRSRSRWLNAFNRHVACHFAGVLPECRQRIKAIWKGEDAYRLWTVNTNVQLSDTHRVMHRAFAGCCKPASVTSVINSERGMFFSNCSVPGSALRVS